MTFEVETTLPGCRGIAARLIVERSAVEIESKGGHATPEETAAALPALVQLLSDRAGLPLRYNGRAYYPTPRPGRREWGEGV